MTIRAIAIAAAFLVATLSSAASAQVINACVKRRDGTLRLVVDPANCTFRETAISWNQVGPQGEPGEDGMDGQPGEAGPEGPTGPSLRLLDFNGVEIGILVSNNAGSFIVFGEPSGTEFVVGRDGDVHPVQDLSGLLYEETGCGGTPYVHTTSVIGGLLYGHGDDFVALVSGSVPAIRTFLSERNSSGGCLAVNRMHTSVPLEAIDLGTLFPAPTPLYIAPAP